MAVEIDVRLTTQSFRQAGGRELFPNLKMGSDVLAHGEGVLKTDALKLAYFNIEKKAKDRGYTHVFGMRHEFQQYESVVGCDAIGTGYMQREE